MRRHRMHALVETFRASTVGVDRRLRCEVRGDAASLYLYDVIGGGWGGGVDPKDVVAALDKCGGKPLDIFVNSPGGDVFDGMAIHSALKRYGNVKTMHVDGLAASAASLVLMSGDKIVCAPGGQIMIHDAWAFAMGNAAELRQTADLLDQTSATLVDMYSARTKQSCEDIAAWMSAETWMTAKTALDRGFCDEIANDAEGDADGDEGAKKNRAAAMKQLEDMKSRLRRASPASSSSTGQPAK